jgi:hypothetical protein
MLVGIEMRVEKIRTADGTIDGYILVGEDFQEVKPVSDFIVPQSKMRR